MALSKTYTKSPCALDRFIQEVNNDAAIPIALDLSGTSILGNQLTVTFKEDLVDWTEVDTLVTNHSGVPLPANASQPVTVTATPEPQPFALPTYRTKRNATDNLISIEPGAMGDIDFKLLADRYVSGGCVIVENAEIGDYITASVEDVDGVIPVPYRTALCEAHPIVARYIEKEWMSVATPGTVIPGSISLAEIDTYPLNAKITAGLYLCIEYHAASSGLTRRVGVTYHLTKKL